VTYRLVINQFIAFYGLTVTIKGLFTSHISNMLQYIATIYYIFLPYIAPTHSNDFDSSAMFTTRDDIQWEYIFRMKTSIKLYTRWICRTYAGSITSAIEWVGVTVRRSRSMLEHATRINLNILRIMALFAKNRSKLTNSNHSILDAWGHAHNRKNKELGIKNKQF